MNDDLISRQAVIKEIESLDFTMSKCLTKEECYGMNRAKEEIVGCVKYMSGIQARIPCDLCRYAPPSSSDGKPCCMCPATD